MHKLVLCCSGTTRSMPFNVILNSKQPQDCRRWTADLAPFDPSEHNRVWPLCQRMDQCALCSRPQACQGHGCWPKLPGRRGGRTAHMLIVVQVHPADDRGGIDHLRGVSNEPLLRPAQSRPAVAPFQWRHLRTKQRQVSACMSGLQSAVDSRCGRHTAQAMQLAAGRKDATADCQYINQPVQQGLASTTQQRKGNFSQMPGNSKGCS